MFVKIAPGGRYVIRRYEILASSINALSYVDPSAYQSTAAPSALSDPADTSASSQTSPPSATMQFQAIERQGALQAFLNNSVAAALLQPTLLQPTTAGSNTDSTTLVNCLLQQAIGAYQTS